MRMAFTIAMRATPTSAKTTSQSVAIPPAPRMRTKQLHSESQRDVLPDNPAGLPARMNGGGHSRRLVCLYHYIGGFDGGIAAKSAHGDAHMAKGKNRGIIDAVAHKGYSVGRVAAGASMCFTFPSGSRSPYAWVMPSFSAKLVTMACLSPDNI